MILIGVTGGVGTGKSTVARMFGQLGAEVLDADRVTHELMERGTPVWRMIHATFGREIVSPAGQINRLRLGALVFFAPKRMARLCRIVHPAVRRRFRERIQAIRRKSPKAVVVLDIPLLIEAGSAYRVDALVVVSAPLTVSARRMRDRSGWTLEETRKRQAFQMPLREKEHRADFVVRNGGLLEATRRQVVRIWRQVVRGERLNGRRKD